MAMQQTKGDAFVLRHLAPISASQQGCSGVCRGGTACPA
jgi:hypothetical protein